MKKMSPVERKAMFTGLAISAGLTGLILFGSQGFLHFDSALLGYATATVFAVFGITFRYIIFRNLLYYLILVNFAPNMKTPLTACYLVL